MQSWFWGVKRELLRADWGDRLRSWLCVQEDRHPQLFSQETNMAYNYPKGDIFLLKHLICAKFLPFSKSFCYCSVAKSCPTLCNPMDCSSPCPSLSPRVCPGYCPGRWWCRPTISSSVTLFPFFLQSFPVSGSFPISWLFTILLPIISWISAF